MKRTITIRVEVTTQREYAKVIAKVVRIPGVTAWHATRAANTADSDPAGKTAKDYLSDEHGIQSHSAFTSGKNHVQKHS